MKTQSLLQVFFLLIGLFFFQQDGIGQNDTTNDAWKTNGEYTYHNRDTSTTIGTQRVAIGLTDFSATDLHIQTSGPEHGLMIQGHHGHIPNQNSGTSGRLGFGKCNFFDVFMTSEGHSSGHCKGHLAFWTDEAWNGAPRNPTIKMILSNRGALGIGIPVEDIPNSVLLAVGGKTMFEDCEIALRQDWPDYVFDASYQLPTIEERAAFYSTYKRLPNFQSGVAMNGKINVQDITIHQQEAIEENAIYISQLHEENKTLKTKNEEMQQRLDTIQKEVEEMKRLVQALSKP